MSTTPTGAISVKDIETVLNVGLATNYPSATSELTFNDTIVRLLAGRPSGSISMNDMRGKDGPLPYGTRVSYTCSNGTITEYLSDGKLGTYTNIVASSPFCSYVFDYTISADMGNFDLRVAATTAGWNGIQPLSATITINSGVTVYASTTSVYAFYISTNFPAGSALSLINRGTIVGRGGDGGKGGSVGTMTLTGAKGVAGFNGNAGGPALYVGYYTSITNYGTIGGGGGGGGGGG